MGVRTFNVITEKDKKKNEKMKKIFKIQIKMSVKVISWSLVFFLNINFNKTPKYLWHPVLIY